MFRHYCLCVLTNSARSGRYVKQPENYDAFIPTPLPPIPSIKITEELQELLSKTDHELGRLDGSIMTLPNPDLFVYMYIRKEAVLSSQIEGTQSTLQDVLEAEAEILRPNRPRDVIEVINYIKSMKYGLAHLEDPVSISLICKIHAQLLDKGRGSDRTPGKVREVQNWIGFYGCTLKEADFVPPPPNEVPKALDNLAKFCSNYGRLPTLVWVGLVHAQFETIHPFSDGNGRVGRLLIIFLLCKMNILSKPVLYLSYFFKLHQQQYYEKLQAVRDDGSWEDWLIFFLRCVMEASKKATSVTHAIQIMREEHRSVITDSFGRTAGNGHRLLEYLYKSPLISVNEVMEITKTGYMAANNLVSKMVECGILIQDDGQSRNRRFRYKKYIELFNNDGDY